MREQVLPRSMDRLSRVANFERLPFCYGSLSSRGKLSIFFRPERGPSPHATARRNLLPDLLLSPPKETSASPALFFSRLFTDSSEAATHGHVPF